MNVHHEAGLTPLGRARLGAVIECGMTVSQATEVCGVCAETASKGYRRSKAQGLEGPRERSSRPGALRRPTPAATCARIIEVRRQRFTGAHIAVRLGVSPATVSRVLRRAGLSRMRDLEPAGPERRHECDHPGELIHPDIKKLGRFETVGHRIMGDRHMGKTRAVGWDCVHVCIDDAARLSVRQIHPDENP